MPMDMDVDVMEMEGPFSWDGVLLSVDLLRHVLATLAPKDHAAALVCRDWAAQWPQHLRSRGTVKPAGPVLAVHQVLESPLAILELACGRKVVGCDVSSDMDRPGRVAVFSPSWELQTSFSLSGLGRPYGFAHDESDPDVLYVVDCWCLWAYSMSSGTALRVNAQLGPNPCTLARHLRRGKLLVGRCPEQACLPTAHPLLGLAQSDVVHVVSAHTCDTSWSFGRGVITGATEVCVLGDDTLLVATDALPERPASLHIFDAEWRGVVLRTLPPFGASVEISSACIVRGLLHVLCTDAGPSRATTSLRVVRPADGAVLQKLWLRPPHDDVTDVCVGAGGLLYATACTTSTVIAVAFL